VDDEIGELVNELKRIPAICQRASQNQRYNSLSIPVNSLYQFIQRSKRRLTTDRTPRIRSSDWCWPCPEWSLRR